MAYIPSSGSVVAFQSDPTKLQVTASIVNFPLTQNVSGSVVASVTFPANQSISGTVVTTQLAGSILATSATVTPAANQSVSGTVNTLPLGTITTSLVSTVPSSVIVGASIFGLPPVNVTNTNLNVGGSVVTFQGTSPWVIGSVSGTVNIAGNPSISGTVNIFQLAGSILATSATVTPAANQSVSGTVNTLPLGTIVTSLVSTVPSSVIVGASIFGLPPVNVTNTNLNVGGSVIAFQGSPPWTQTFSNSSLIAYQAAGSILATSATINTGNSSVQLLTGTAYIGSITAYQGVKPWDIAGSVAAIVTNTPSISGTINILQLAGSILATSATVSAAANQSVSGTVGASIIGAPPVTQGGTWIASVFGNVSVIGTVPVTESGTWTASLVSTIPSSVIVGSSIFGQLPAGTAPLGSVAALQGTNPWLMTFGNSSIIATQLAGSILATSATVSMSNSSVQLLRGTETIGSVAAYLQSANASVVTVWKDSSVVAYQLAGSILATSATVNPAANQSVSGAVTAPAGSTMAVSATQTTTPWITNFQNSSLVTYQLAGSILATSATVNAGNSSVMLLNSANVIGSVATLQGTNPWIETFSNSSIIAIAAGSITGTYAEDSGHTSGDKGLAIWGVRNDTIASTASADLDYTIFAVDSAGRTLIKPFASEDSTIISYFGSVVSGSVTLIQASAVGKKNYITDFWAANTGSSNTLITFQDGSTSILGFTIAPAGSGSNSPGIAIPLKTNVSQDLAFKVSPSTSVLYLTVKGYQSP